MVASFSHAGLEHPTEASNVAMEKETIHAFFLGGSLLGATPLKTNMEHNHGGLEDHFPF